MDYLSNGLPELHAKIDSINATISGAMKDAQSGLAGVSGRVSSQIESGMGVLPQPKDLFLFVKNYDWSLRYRVRRVASHLDTTQPLELKWVKLRKAPTSPEQVVSNADESDLFDWTETAPASHKGFMYEVTHAVGSGVEAVINFFKGRGVNLIVQAEGISLAPLEAEATAGAAEAKPRPVTHCWVDVSGLPFFPSVKAIDFFNSQENVLAWRA